MKGALCTPAKAGAAAGAATGLVVWALMAFVPAFHNGVPEAIVAVIPVALCWAGHVAGAYLTPHKPAASPARSVPVKGQGTAGVG